jgi:transposase InsO family protein
VPKSSPGRRAEPIRGYIAKKIRDWREDYLWGAEVISAHLLHGEGIDVKKGRIYRFLKRKGLITGKRRYDKRSKHTRVVQVFEPGQHTQTDVKYLPRILRNPVKSYVYNFVDHAAKWEFKRAYDSFGPSETHDFMARLLREIPFRILRLQTDNGIENTFKYVTNLDNPRKHALDSFCEANGIRHVLIPPGEKELQGLVERSHRMDDEELYHRIRPRDLKQLNEELEKHSRWKNSTRRRKSLGWKTPLEWLKEYEARKIQNQENQAHTEESHDLLRLVA